MPYQVYQAAADSLYTAAPPPLKNIGGRESPSPSLLFEEGVSCSQQVYKTLYGDNKVSRGCLTEAAQLLMR